jgi:predicted DsbA family dithiol-disulfide isomerase
VNTRTAKLTSLGAAALATSLLACAGFSTDRGSSPTVGQIGARRITLAEVDAAAGADRAHNEIELYKARRIALERMVEDALLEAEASSLGLSQDDLLEREVDDEVREPSEAVVRHTYEELEEEGKIRGRTYEEVAPAIRDALTQPYRAARRAEYLRSLRAKTVVETELPLPRIDVETAGGYERGPKDAPVTLVEFSHFQCPSCGSSQATLRQVLAEYEGEIRHVFMDFPHAIHPMAYPAALAGRCANEQGRFWEYRDVLLARQQDLSADYLVEWAGELGLDRGRFARCLESRRYEAEIRQSIESGQKAGANIAPRFFLNGVPLGGALRVDALREMIDDEIARVRGASGIRAWLG